MKGVLSIQAKQIKVMAIRFFDKGRHPRWLLIGLILFAWAIQLYHLEARPLYGDEYGSIREAYEFGSNPHALLYYALLRLWLIGGDGEFWLRFLSALLVTLVVPLAYQLARSWFEEQKLALFVALFITVAPLRILYGQQIRFYALLLVTGTLNLQAFGAFICHPSRRNMALWVIATVLLASSHLMGWLLLACEVVVLMLKRIRGRYTKLGIVGLLVLALVAFVVCHEMRTIAFIALSYLTKNDVRFVGYSGPRGLGLAQVIKVPFTLYVFLVGEHVYPLRWELMLPAISLGTVVGIRGVVKSLSIDFTKTIILLALFLAPILLLYLVADPVSPPGLQGASPRYVLFLLPLLLLLLAQGTYGIFGRFLFMLLLVVNGGALYSYFCGDWSYANCDLTDWRGAAKLVQKYVDPQAILVYDGRSADPTARYFPEELSRHASGSMWTGISQIC